jgi:transcriptional regulator with PAS, ATPase and Fis domain
VINWEELKHIHVIRKLEEILGNWYKTDLFFVDDRGEIKNWNPDDKREFKNQVTKALSRTTQGQKLITDLVVQATEIIASSDKNNIEIDGFFGFEKCVISKISLGSDFYGFVLAYPFLVKSYTASEKEKIKTKAQEFAIGEGELDLGFGQLKPLQGSELEHYKQLVDLVAQEIIEFHTEISKREERINALNQELGVRYRYDNMIGKSKPMQELYSLLDKIKSSESTVLIQGENGTGKELIAKAIHYNSPRKDKEFVPVNCSAFNENLLDSELFGHVKGAFTGAVKDKKGLFEAANGGTLFLDEIGDMSLTMQVKLLRVLQEGTFIPVGGTETKKVDVRVIAATNRDLKEMIENGEFREDLYYRINVINVYVPPLRERKEDIPLLCDYFLDKICKEKGLPRKQIMKRAMEKIYDYAWPGNIRQLENEIERLVVLSGDDTKITYELLSPAIKEWGEKTKVQGVKLQGKLKDALEEMEKTMIREGLKRTGWNKSKLAKELGISRASLIMKVEKYGLDKRKLARTVHSGDSQGEKASDASEHDDGGEAA